MYFEGTIAFSIADVVDFEENINEKIGFMPTKITKKGELIAIKQKAPFNIWRYELGFNDLNFTSTLSAFNNQLAIFRNNITDISCEYERVEINLYVRTLFGQFGFSIPNEELVKLSSFGIGVNFHFLSFGDVTN